MASPDRSKRKILKAKKTMPASCRKQIEILSKSKNVEALKTATGNSNMSSGNQNSNTGAISSKYGRSENAASLLDSNKNSVCSPKSKVLCQNVTKPLETVDSETRSEYIEEQVVCPSPKPTKTIESSRRLFTQETKDSQNTSKSHFECQTGVTMSYFEQREEDCTMNSICCPSSLSGVVDIPKSTGNSTLDDEIINKILSHSETNSNSESHDERQGHILSSETHFVPFDKIPTLVNSVISSNCPADILKSAESCRTCHSSISDSENVDSTWLSALDMDSNNSHNQKKRIFPENKETVKRIKTSEQINENICVALEKQTAFLEQVKHLIRQEIYSVSYKLFDNKLKELTERIGKTQCRNKHEAIADELFGSETILYDSTMMDVYHYTFVKTQGALTTKSEPCCGVWTLTLVMMCQYSFIICKKHTTVFIFVFNFLYHFSNNDGVMLISVESPNLTAPITSNPTDTGKTTSESSNSSSDAETEGKDVEKKFDSVIDLTKDAQSKCNTENSESTLESPTKAVSTSNETTLVAQNAAQAPESFEHLPPLPEPPALLPELVDKIRDTLPPQKTELKVKRVLKPRGIALTWNITKINPKCAPVESYHLFLCHENPNNKLIWKKIGEIKALPLPMACTLSQFLISNKYYFTVQSKDIFGRYGPFCDIKSIPGFPDNLT
ncbi:MCAF2 protein, partial [Crocuta crocuta]